MTFLSIPQELEQIIEKAFGTIEITPQEKKAISGLIFIGLYKGMLEVLLGFLGNDAEFSQDLGMFFQKSLAKLSPEQRQSFERVIDEEKMRLIETTLFSIADNLPKEEGGKVKENLIALLGKK